MGPLRDHCRLAVFTCTMSFGLLLGLLPSAASTAHGGTLPDTVLTEPETAPADSAAEAPRYHLPPTVVTAERIPVSLDRVPSDLTVIGRDRLQLNQTPFLADELRLVPGLDVQRSGSPGKLTDVRLRGADPRHTLVLFDGIPINGPWTGTFNFADLPSAGWGRIEVMGGPASALYGSGAVGGVIQILSADSGLRPRARALAEYGEHETFVQSAELSGARGGLGLGAMARRLTSEGLGARDGYLGLMASVHGEAKRETKRSAVSALVTRGKKEIPYDYRFDPGDFSTHQVRDLNSDETDDLFAARAAHSQNLGNHFAVEAEISGMAGRIDYRNRPDSTGGDYVNTQLDNSRLLFGLRGVLDRLGPARTVMGLELRTEDVHRDDRSQYGGFPVNDRLDVEGVTTRSAYAQMHLEQGRLLLDAGLRADDHARYGSIGVPRVAVALNAREAGLKIRGGYGRAFTAPTLSDLYYPLYGTPTLRPERSTTWEAGADGLWLHGAIEARATWHRTEFKDLIQANSYFLADNIGRARIEGEEYSIRMAPARLLAVSARAAHLVAKNLDGGARLPKRPPWRAGVSAELYPASWLATTASLRWVDPMPDPFAFYDLNGRYLSGDTPGYASLDLGLYASLLRWIPAEARLRVSNSLDRKYSEVRGYPALGRSVTASLAYVFGPS